MASSPLARRFAASAFAAASVLILLLHLPPRAAAAVSAEEQVVFDPFDYSSAAYWDNRYSKQAGDTFEWYGVKWSILNTTLSPHITRGDRVLHFGTGNSRLPEEMHRDGYHQQVATDISATVIEQMRKRLGHLTPPIEFRVEDASRTSLDASSFDMVLEKGTLEAVGSDRDCALIDPGCELLHAEKAIALEAFRLLRPGGLFVAIADEFQDFAELRASGLDRVERVALTEKDGVPIPKTVFLFFKKGLSGPRHDEI